MKFYLIQRGTINNDVSSFKKFTGYASDGAFVNLDYMGSSEFEWGTIPKAYRRILDQIDQYELFETDLITTNESKTFWLYCHKDHKDEILEEIKNYIKKEYHLKEWSDLPDHFKPIISNLSYCKYKLNTNFWWDVQNDWIGFVCGGKYKGKIKNGKGKAEAFKAMMLEQYKTWWIEGHTEEDRKMQINEAYNNRRPF